MDFSSFSDTNFDAVNWINETLKTSKTETMDSFISSLIMKLQLLSQEVSSSFEETSAQTLVRMPRALMEIERMSKEAKGLRQTLSALLQGDASDAQRHTQQAVERMNTLHQVKQKLDTCLETIAQVAYLQSSIARMTVVFTEGNTVAIGSEISQMQAALKRLSDYPEQHNRFSAKVADFEAQLVNLVETDCLNALIQHDVPKAQEHLNTLQKIGKVDGVVRQFVQRSITQILDAWRAYDPSSDFAVWLPTFIAEIKAFVSRERPYYMEVFGPAEYPRRGAHLIICILESLTPSFQSRITGMPLPALVQAYSATALLYSYCCTEFLDSPADEITANTITDLKAQLEQVIYQPYLPQQKKYDQLEKTHLQACLKRFPWVERATDPNGTVLTPALVQAIAESSSHLFVLAEEGLNRCLEFTDGVESPGFFTTLNDVMVEYADLISKLVKLHGQSEEQGPPPKSPVVLGVPVAVPKSPIPPSSPLDTGGRPGKKDSSTVKVGLHLHQICTTMTTKLDQFEAVAKGIVLGKRQSMLREKSPLLRDNPGKANTLAYFLNSLESLKIPMFSLATKHFNLLAKDIESLVFNALFEQIRGWLSGIPQMPVWGAAGQEGVPVEHPMEYIRSIGDYLFDLPMLILSQVPGGQVSDEADEGAQSRYWVDVVVRGCLDLFLQSIEQIPHLSSSGCEQLACDIDYIKDVLLMLSDTPPPVLQDLHSLLCCDAQEMATHLATVACPERMPLYKSLRAKRLSPAVPKGSGTPETRRMSGRFEPKDA